MSPDGAIAISDIQYFSSVSEAGPLAIVGFFEPSNVFDSFGFRCAR